MSVSIDSSRVSATISALVHTEFAARGIEVRDGSTVKIVLFTMATPRIVPADPHQYNDADNVLWVGVRSLCDVDTVPSRLHPTDYVHSQWNLTTGLWPALYQILITVYTDSIPPTLHHCLQNHITFSDIACKLPNVRE